MLSKVVLVFLFLLPISRLMGQKQLLLLSRGKVMVRYSNGDDFIYKLKKSKTYTKGFITDIKKFAVITFNDTIPFSAIDRVSLKGHPQPGFSLLSKFFITLGVGYFVIDEFNNIIVKGNKPDFEPMVWQPALILVGTGFILKSIHKRSQRIRYPAKLVMIER